MTIIERVSQLNRKLEEYDERLLEHETKFKQLNDERDDMLNSSTLAEYNERVTQFNKRLDELKAENEDINEEAKNLQKEIQQLEGGTNA